jgi:hypothetical protein
MYISTDICYIYIYLKQLQGFLFHDLGKEGRKMKEGKKGGRKMKEDEGGKERAK